ncbi:MAG: sigma-70 family RNA polymerase sigma factor [Ardenticatenaceae bacterium]|nr:sigma-70 family RNA polymerase sigma factor [Ardenticatenaceae bacterium]
MPGLEINLACEDNEDVLLEGLRSGEPDACTCLVKRFAPMVYNQALRMIRDADEAESILQQTFIKACQKIGDFEGRSALGTWLYRIATNEALMKLRRRRAPMASIEEIGETIQPNDLPQNLSEWPVDPADAVLDSELRDHLEEALAALPETLRVVFVLRELQGLSTADTAETLGLGQSAVKVRLHRARLRLRELLAGYLAPEGGA